MENDTTLTKQGLLEPVVPGSGTFDSSILSPLQNNYLYEESKECFTYSSANLIKNKTLQGRYSAFRAEKQKKGYSEEELEESFGFLLFDDESRAKTLADTGLLVGQGTCTTLGDSSKGVYISKYSDCLDLKHWYDGKTGYIVLLKLTKGRVKEVTENYTQNFTPPTTGFDCHVSDQLGAVCATTSSFLAFERTQYYMYELLDGGRKPEPCPRHVCPFAVVAFSYGKSTTSLQLRKEKSQEKTSFHYQPWSGQLKIQSVEYDVGLQSVHGAVLPANLPKTVKVDHAIGVSELRKTLPQSIFETSFLGEVSRDSRCFRLYDVVSLEEKNDLSVLTQELKEKDLALVTCLDDGGFLILLHSSHFLSYEGVGTDKASGIQGMFIFPDTRTVPRETKMQVHSKPKISKEVLRVLPALNYAESEIEKCPPNQQGEPLSAVEKHLQNFATLILPGLSSSPAREASMFPDQYDVPDGFTLIAPKWTDDAGARLKTYLKNPCSFLIPVARAAELLVPEKQQCSDDDQDDDVFYYISSPEEAPRTPAGTADERDVVKEDAVSGSINEEMKTTVKQQQAEEKMQPPADVPHSALPEKAGTPGTVVIVSSDNPFNRTDSSPKSGDLPENCVETTEEKSEKAPQGVPAVNNKSSGDTESTQEFLKEGPIETTSTLLPENESRRLSVSTGAAKHLEASPHMEAETQEVGTSESRPAVDKDASKEVCLPTSISTPVTSENQTEALVKASKKAEPLKSSHVSPQKKRNTKVLIGYRSRRKRKALKRNLMQVDSTSVKHENVQNSTASVDAVPEQSSSGSSKVVDTSPSDPLNKNWRSLPRRKKHWSPEEGIKRVLRSVAKSSETETSIEKSPSITEPTLPEQRVSSTPKRKMEGFSMRERYGLKTIITDCGFVFVPHGSEVAAADIQSSKELKDSQDSSLVTTTSPAMEKPDQTDAPSLLQLENSDLQTPPTHIPQNVPSNTSANAPSSTQSTENDAASQKLSDQPLTPDLKKGNTKQSVYKAISISKLKTVLRRAKRTKSPGPKDQEQKPALDSAEPKLKRDRPSSVIASPKLDSGKLSPLKDANIKTIAAALQKVTKLTGPEPSKTSPSKQGIVSRRELKTPPVLEKLKPKENGCITFDPSGPNEIVKQAGQQPVSALTGIRVGGKSVSSEGKSSKAALATTSPPPHSDALNLLADLALSATSEKMLHNPAKSRRESHAGVETSGSPESVLHALLRSSAARFKLPPQSPFPEGLLVPGDFLLEISKEHSYSQPTSLLSGLPGACPQSPPPAGCAGALLSLSPKHQPKLPDHSSGPICDEKGGKNGWRHPAPLHVPRKARLSHHRKIVEKAGLLQVARVWKEKYDFRFDSRFTNDSLEKSVSRALHGNWDFSIEDTFEQVHLIFHMWIGLFYSKPTSRFFHFDQNGLPVERKDPPIVLNTVSPIQATAKQPDVGLSSKEDPTSSSRLPVDILDLSVKPSGLSGHCTVTLGNSNESPTTCSDVKVGLEHTAEIKKPNPITSSYQAPNVPAKVPAGDYRQTVKSVKDSLVLDVDESDGENDATTENSYTKLLESNSAYGHLCDQASKMHIHEGKILNVQMNAEEQQKMPEVLQMIQSSGSSVAPVAVPSIDQKSVGLFHQLAVPLGPVIFLKPYTPSPQRKIIVASQSLSNKAEAVVMPVSRPSESVSKGESDATELTGKCAKAEGTSQTLDKKDSAGSVAACGEHVGDTNENAQMKVISAIICRDSTHVVLSAKVKTSPPEQTHLSVYQTDQRPVHEVIEDIPVFVNDEAKDGIKPTRPDEHAKNDGSDATKGSITFQTTEKERPRPDVRDPTSKHDVGADVAMHNMKNDVYDKANVKEKDGFQSVNDGKIVVDVQDVNDNLEGRAGTTVSVQNVSDEGNTEAAKEEVRPKPDVRDYTFVGEVESMGVQDNATKEKVLKENEKIASDEVKGSNDIDKRKGEQILCDRPNSELDSNVESLVSPLEKDCTDCVDMEISDVEDSKGENEGESLSEQTESSTGKLQEGEMGAERSEVSNDREQTSPVCNVQQSTKIADDSYADMQSLNAGQFSELKEGHSARAAGDTNQIPVPVENNSKSEVKVRDHTPGVWTDNPEASQPKQKSVYSNVSPSTTPISPELGERIESGDSDSTKAVGDPDISNASVAVTQEADSSKDISPAIQGLADQRRKTPTICKMSAAKIAKIQDRSDSDDASPPSLEIDTENELNSRSCTPTQDELPYSLAGPDDLRVPKALDNHKFSKTLHPVHRSPTGLEPSSSGTGSHRAQSIPEGTSRPRRKHDAALKVTNYRKAFVSDDSHEPKKSALHFEDKVDSSPSKDGRLQKDPSENWTEQYEEESWVHGSSFSTDVPYHLRELYACDEEPDEAPPAHFRNNASIHSEVAQMPREATESVSDISDWVHNFHNAASTSNVDKSNKRAFPFRHQDDLGLSGSNDDVNVHCTFKKKRKKTFYREKWDEEDVEEVSKYRVRTISSSVDRTKTLRKVTCSPHHQKGEGKQCFDWRRYFRREGIFDAEEENRIFVRDPPSSIVTVLDKKGNRVIYENASSLKRSGGTLTAEDSKDFHDWDDQRSKSDNTLSLMEEEYLIFSENMNRMLKTCKVASKAKSHHRPNLNPAESPMTIQFSRFDEQESSSQFEDTWPSLTKFKINVDMSERKGSGDFGNYGKPLHLQSLFCERGNEASSSKISDISKECAKSYNTLMNDICTGKSITRQKDKMQRKWDSESTPGSKQPAFCGRIKKAMFDYLHDNLNSIVRQACKIKYKFYILATSDDPFFEETKDLLEAGGHKAVEPKEFDIDDSDQTPLIIILRNEDIAEHICKVPHLLDLKKSSKVLFAGIDQPDDVVNLTHQELFAKGGFVVFDEIALDTLSLEHMKKVVGIMEELDKKGKWKWFLHYRDSRKLRENARCSPEAQMKKHFMDCCQEAGIVEVLPYHECDVISRDKPDYLRCLVRLQVQNASTRFPVFITDTQTESFGKNGILTMNIYTFSRILSNDTCSVS